MNNCRSDCRLVGSPPTTPHGLVLSRCVTRAISDMRLNRRVLFERLLFSVPMSCSNNCAVSQCAVQWPSRGGSVDDHPPTSPFTFYRIIREEWKYQINHTKECVYIRTNQKREEKRKETRKIQSVQKWGEVFTELKFMYN